MEIRNIHNVWKIIAKILEGGIENLKPISLFYYSYDVELNQIYYYMKILTLCFQKPIYKKEKEYSI